MNNIDINPEILNKINLIFKNVFNKVSDLDYYVDKYLLTKIEEKRRTICKFICRSFPSCTCHFFANQKPQTLQHLQQNEIAIPN